MATMDATITSSGFHHYSIFIYSYFDNYCCVNCDTALRHLTASSATPPREDDMDIDLLNRLGSISSSSGGVALDAVR